MHGMQKKKMVHVMDVPILLLLLLFHVQLIMAVDSQGSDQDTCVSVVVHDFYSTQAHQAQPAFSPCNSNNKSAGVFWLGATTNISRDQLIARHLRIGVPLKIGFTEFMKVKYDPRGQPIVSGFPVDVFKTVIAMLPYEITYEFIPFQGNGVGTVYYDELISRVYLKEYDAVVGDTEITAARMDLVDFTSQYMESGISMIVPIENDDVTTPWWFMKPLTINLWVTTLAFAVLKGILVWFFEHRKNPEFQGSPSKLIGKILSFSFSTLLNANFGIWIITLIGIGKYFIPEGEEAMM